MASPAKSRAVVLHEATRGGAHPVRAQVLAAVARTAAACLLVAGLAWCFSDCATTQESVLFVAAAFTLTFLLQLLAIGERGAKLVPLACGVTAVVAVVALVAVPSFRDGLFEFGNQLITRYDEVFNAYVPLLPAPTQASGWLFYALAGVMTALVIDLLVRRRMAVATTLVVFVVGAVGLWLHTGQALPALIVSLIGWAIVWRGSLGGTTTSLRAAVFAACSAAVALVLAVGVSSAYEPNPAVDRVREGFVETVDTLRFGSDTLPEGDLTKAPAMNRGDEERLTLSFDQALADDMLLRGFVGATYHAGKWEPLDHTAYEGDWTGMFGWLSAQGFSPNEQRAAFADQDAVHGAEQPPVASLSVETTGANRTYVYAPTTLRTLEGADVIANRDGSMLAQGVAGAGSYTMEVDALDAAADVAVTPSWLISASQDDPYAASEAVYRSFVRDRYLAIDDEDRALVETLLFDDTTWNNDNPTPAAVIARIRAMLSTLASYTDSPTLPPRNENFLSWFLTQEHEGNAAYFSTAAVLAFRAQDIPARYVEGYRADVDTLTRAAADDGGRATLTSADAHAWVEIYLDGIGWSPVDVSPGFYDQPYQVEDVIEVNQTMAGDSGNDASNAGALGGDVNEGDREPDQQAAVRQVAGALLVILGMVAALLCGVLAVLEVRRHIHRARRKEQCESDNQALSVPALFDTLGAYLGAAGVTFKPEHPLDATSAVVVAFPDVAPEEYERIVSLVQKSVFGCKELRAHEMRALRRFVLRFKSGLKPSRNIREAFARRYRFEL